jgi:indolepyruvate ferredoxin oxidoreductase
VLAGLNTAGFVSGYRGSPLGALDQSLWKAQKFLERAHITFQPGLNEDLAATGVVGLAAGEPLREGEVRRRLRMWYGKGSRAWTAAATCSSTRITRERRSTAACSCWPATITARKSSTLPHQSDHQFSAALIPVLYPSSVQEILDLGLHGWAMSRYSGCWVGFKCVADTVESSSSVYIDPERTKIVVPDDFPFPPDGVSIRWPDKFLETEARMQDYKVYAALHYCRVNQLNRSSSIRRSRGSASSRAARAISTCGRRWTTSASPRPTRPRSASRLQDRDDVAARARRRASLREGWKRSSSSRRKRQIVEYQLKEQLYNWRDDVRPRVVGKFDEKGEWVQPHGDWLLPALSELTPAMIARVIAQRIRRLGSASARVEKLNARVDWINAKEKALAKPKIMLERIPYFCSGCPHNTSTNVPKAAARPRASAAT